MEKNGFKKKQNLITLILAIFSVIVIGGGALLVANGKWPTLNFFESDDVDNINAAKEFANLTKEQAIAFLKNGKDVNHEGILPDNYVGSELLDAVIMNGSTIVSDLKMVYSYDSLNELKNIAEEEYGGFFGNTAHGGYEIKEYDYYAIVTPNRVKGATSCDHGYNTDCDSLLSFKRKYLDYKEEVKYYSGGGASHNDVMYMNTRDSKIMSYLLRVITLYSSVGLFNMGGHGNIHSYSFEEGGSQYVLTVNNVGAGVNMETKEGYAINLYRRYFAVDKSNGYVHQLNTSTGVMDYIKSFAITKEELNALPGYGS